MILSQKRLRFLVKTNQSFDAYSKSDSSFDKVCVLPEYKGGSFQGTELDCDCICSYKHPPLPAPPRSISYNLPRTPLPAVVAHRHTEGTSS